jgi:EmrB/QacA subfamily drug resistance transporter
MVAPRPATAAQRRWTLWAAVMGSGMAFIDGTVVNVALPAIQRSLDMAATDVQWVIEAYGLLLASLLLVGGSLGDALGRRRVFMAGIVLFGVASVGCAMAASSGQLIAARAVQGIGAALLVPGSLALISATFPPAERGRAIGIWSAWSGITAAAGPLIGGWLVDQYSWRWAFAINVPIAVLLWLICAARVPESRSHEQRGAVDVAGAVLATLGLGGVSFALIEAPAAGWQAPAVIGAAVVGVLALIAFVRVEATSRAPMLPLALFGLRAFTGANVITLLLYAALGGGLFFVPLNLIQVQGHSATFAGAALLPFVVIMFALSRWTGTLADRFGPRRPLIAGPLIAALGFAAFAVGMALTVAPLTATVMNSVDTDLAGTASGINNAISRAAGLLAIAAFGMLMAWRFDAVLIALLQGLPLPNDVAAAIVDQRHKLAGLTLPDGLPNALADPLREAVGQAFVSGFRWVMAVCTLLALLAAVSAAVLIEDERTKPA